MTFQVVSLRKGFLRAAISLFFTPLLFIACEESTPISKPAFFEKTFGYANYDECYDIIELRSGDLLAVGYSGSGGFGEADFLVHKLGPDGETLWTRFYGGSQFDQCYSAQEDAAGNLYLGGYTNSWGLGYTDYHVLKLNPDGDQFWSRTFGGLSLERAYSMIWTSEDELLLSGSFQEGPYTNSEIGVLRINAEGEELWQAHFGGSANKVIQSSCPTSDGRVVLSGWTDAGGNDNVLLVKMDTLGVVLWEKTLGTQGVERCHDITLCDDGGFLLTGYQFIDFDKNRDIYLIKTDSDGNQLWDYVFGGNLNEEAWAVEQDPYGDFFVAGFSESFSSGGNDAFLLKVSAAGQGLGYKSFGGVSHDYSRTMCLAGNGDILLGGYSYSSGAGVSDFFIVRTDTSLTPL